MSGFPLVLSTLVLTLHLLFLWFFPGFKHHKNRASEEEISWLHQVSLGIMQSRSLLDLRSSFSGSVPSIFDDRLHFTFLEAPYYDYWLFTYPDSSCFFFTKRKSGFVTLGGLEHAPVLLEKEFCREKPNQKDLERIHFSVLNNLEMASFNYDKKSASPFSSALKPVSEEISSFLISKGPAFAGKPKEISKFFLQTKINPSEYDFFVISNLAFLLLDFYVQNPNHVFFESFLAEFSKKEQKKEMTLGLLKPTPLEVLLPESSSKKKKNWQVEWKSFFRGLEFLDTPSLFFPVQNILSRLKNLEKRIAKEFYFDPEKKLSLVFLPQAVKPVEDSRIFFKDDLDFPLEVRIENQSLEAFQDGSWVSLPVFVPDQTRLVVSDNKEALFLIEQDKVRRYTPLWEMKEIPLSGSFPIHTVFSFADSLILPPENSKQKALWIQDQAKEISNWPFSSQIPILKAGNFLLAKNGSRQLRIAWQNQQKWKSRDIFMFENCELIHASVSGYFLKFSARCQNKEISVGIYNRLDIEGL